MRSEEPQTELDAANLGARARTAIGWQFLSQGLGTAIQMVATILLCRLLMPKDYGILGMAMMLTGLAATFRDLGFGQALIQRKHLERKHLVSAFWGSLMMGAILTGILFVTAPYAAIFFKEPRIVAVIRVMSTTFLITPFGNIPAVLLQRQLDFRTPVIASLSSALAYALVGVIMAITGYGYWSLVGALLASFLVGVVVTCIITHYTPPLIPSFRGLSELLSFGLGTTGSGLFRYMAGQLDYFVVGRGLDATALGLYTRAFTLAHMPLEQLSGVLLPVLFPAFSQMQQDPARARAAFARVLTGTAVFCFPLLTLLAIIAPEFMPVILGKQWGGAVLPLQIMCFASMLQSICHPSANLTKAFGQVQGEMWRRAVYAVTLGGAAYFGLRWGIVGVSCGVLFANVVLLGLLANLVYQSLSFGLADYWEALHQPVMVAAMTALGVWYFRLALIQVHLPDYAILALTCTCSIVILTLLLLLPLFRKTRTLIREIVVSRSKC
jgi:PST family polysaccharide transporter